MSEKKTYRVKREAWLYGDLYAVGATLPLMPLQAKPYLRDGVLEEVAEVAPAKSAPAPKAKPKPASSVVTVESDG